MNKYRILLLFDKNQVLDTTEIQKKMMTYGISNIYVEEGPHVGNKASLHLNFDSDIPISQGEAANIIPERQNTIDVMQEVKDEGGNWVNVDKTFPKLCEAEECTNDKTVIVTQGEKGRRRLTFLCDHHVQLLNNGSTLRLKQS
jgi:hypothetical protein